MDAPGQGPAFGTDLAWWSVLAADAGGVIDEDSLLGEQRGVEGPGGGAALQGQECVDDLLGPAPRFGVGDRDQLPEHVRGAQLVAELVVAVIGCPGVVHGDAGEVRHDPGGVHAFAAPVAALTDELNATPTRLPGDRRPLTYHLATT